MFETFVKFEKTIFKVQRMRISDENERVKHSSCMHIVMENY